MLARGGRRLTHFERKAELGTVRVAAALNTQSGDGSPVGSRQPGPRPCRAPERSLLERISFLIMPNGVSRAQPAVHIPGWEVSAGCPRGTVYSHHFSGLGSAATAAGPRGTKDKTFGRVSKCPWGADSESQKLQREPPASLLPFLGLRLPRRRWG